MTGHQQEIYSLEFSREGDFLVSGSGDKSTRIWDVTTGACVFDLKINDVMMGESGPIDAGITSVACKWLETYRIVTLDSSYTVDSVSPDSKLVAAGSLDTIVRVWRARTGEQVDRLRGHKDSVYRSVEPYI